MVQSNNWGASSLAVKNVTPTAIATADKGDALWLGQSANEWTAIGTIALAAAGVVTLFITAISVFMIRRQLTLTRKALESTDRSLHIADEANRIARDSSARSLRAWIDITTQVRGIEQENDYIQIRTETFLENIGKTPALDPRLGLKATFQASFTTVGETPDLDHLVMRPMSSLLPGGKYIHREMLRIPVADYKPFIEKCEQIGASPVITVDALVCYRLETDDLDAPERRSSTRRLLTSSPQTPYDDEQKLRWTWLDPAQGNRTIRFQDERDKTVRDHLT